MEEATFSRALRYIAEVQTMIAAAGDGRKTYDEFLHTLRQYRHRCVDSSAVISTVKKLFHEHYPDLLDGFKAFVPSHRATEFAAPPAAAAEEEEDPKWSSVDFLNRIKARLGGRAYLRLLESMHEYARAEIGVADVVDAAVALFGENADLVAEFEKFLPESRGGEGSRKRRRADRGEEIGDFELWQRGVRRRGSDSGSDENAGVPAPRRTARRLMTGEQKAAKRVADRDNGMEESLCAVEVRIENLKTSIKSAQCLHDRLSRGRLSPAAVRLDEHFTQLNLGCIRSFHEKFLEDADVDLVRALPELMEVLKKKMEAFERGRVKIAQRWKLIRNSYSP